VDEADDAHDREADEHRWRKRRDLIDRVTQCVHDLCGDVSASTAAGGPAGLTDDPTVFHARIVAVASVSVTPSLGLRCVEPTGPTDAFGTDGPQVGADRHIRRHERGTRFRSVVEPTFVTLATTCATGAVSRASRFLSCQGEMTLMLSSHELEPAASPHGRREA